MQLALILNWFLCEGTCMSFPPQKIISLPTTFHLRWFWAGSLRYKHTLRKKKITNRGQTLQLPGGTTHLPPKITGSPRERLLRCLGLGVGEPQIRKISRCPWKIGRNPKKEPKVFTNFQGNTHLTTRISQPPIFSGLCWGVGWVAIIMRTHKSNNFNWQYSIASTPQVKQQLG